MIQKVCILRVRAVMSPGASRSMRANASSALSASPSLSQAASSCDEQHDISTLFLEVRMTLTDCLS